MSKIIKHTFTIPDLHVENGELVEGTPVTKTYQFTLLYKGVGIYEEAVGKPLFDELLGALNSFDPKETDVAKVLNKEFIKNLACCSYVKIDGNNFHNNRATFEEFKRSAVYPLIEQDFVFINKLINMAVDCLYDKEKKKSNEVSRSKK